MKPSSKKPLSEEPGKSRMLPAWSRALKQRPDISHREQQQKDEEEREPDGVNDDLELGRDLLLARQADQQKQESRAVERRNREEVHEPETNRDLCNERERFGPRRPQPLGDRPDDPDRPRHLPARAFSPVKRARQERDERSRHLADLGHRRLRALADALRVLA